MYLREGDGLYSYGDIMSSEPLTSVRMVRSILQKKRSQSLKVWIPRRPQRSLDFQDDKDVEATVCLRAIERLDEYEERIESLKTKMSRALQNNDNEYVSYEK